jgi:hypothetical protein
MEESIYGESIYEKQSIYKKQSIYEKEGINPGDGITLREGIYKEIYLREEIYLRRNPSTGNLSTRSNYEKESTILSIWEACWHGAEFTDSNLE